MTILHYYFFSDNAKEEIKTIIGEKIEYYGNPVNIPEGTKSIDVTLYEAVRP